MKSERFGVRQCVNVVFRAKKSGKLGTMSYVKNQPVLYIDSATTSTLEQAASTSYAQGGRGNSRLIAWEGDKTVTFTVTDALLSPIGLSILSGAHLIPRDVTEGAKNVNYHMTTVAEADNSGVIDLTSVVGDTTISATAPFYVLETEDDGSIKGVIDGATVDGTGKKITCAGAANKTVMIDYYIIKQLSNMSEIHITADSFAGNWYVEGDTLFRRQADGVDLPAMLTFPNVKIQSNFNFTMAGTGDPSTFDFTMDAFPDYTLFDKSHKVICAIQILDDADEASDDCHTVFGVNEASPAQAVTITSVTESTQAEFDTEGIEDPINGALTAVTDPVDATVTYALKDGADATVATIAADGTITPLKVGTTTAVATASKAGYTSATQEVTVTVTEIA